MYVMKYKFYILKCHFENLEYTFGMCF